MALLSRLAAFGLILIAVACGRSPAAPGQLPGSTGPAGQTTFTISSGETGEPVAGATVTASGTQVRTNAAGEVRFPATLPNCAIDVKAAGFLDRRTCGSSIARQITLWPIANADEEEDTRRWIFHYDRIDGRYWRGPTQIALGPELMARADVAETWRAATDTLDQVSRGRIKFQWVTSAPEEGLVLEAAVMPLKCSVAPPWPYEIGGFCVRYDDRVYYLDRLRVAPERLTDATTALRALLSGVGIGPHTLPGLLNANRPDSALSGFERKTLGMLGLRPRTVVWPTTITFSESVRSGGRDTSIPPVVTGVDDDVYRARGPGRSGPTPSHSRRPVRWPDLCSTRPEGWCAAPRSRRPTSSKASVVRH